MEWMEICHLVSGNRLPLTNIHKNIKKVFYASSSRQLGPKNFLTSNTIKGGSRRAKKSRKVLIMMMKAANWGDRTRSRAGAGREQSKSGAKA